MVNSSLKLKGLPITNTQPQKQNKSEHDLNYLGEWSYINHRATA